MNRLCAVTAAVSLLVVLPVWAQSDADGGAGIGRIAVPVGTSVAQPVLLQFPGGSVSDLCAAREAALKVRTVPVRPYERTLPALEWPLAVPGPTPDSSLAPAGGVANPAVALDIYLARELRLGIRPGWLLERPTGAPVASPRSLSPARDGEVIPFIDFRANPISLTELREQLAAHSRLPIVLGEGVDLPGDRFPVYARAVPVSQAIQALAEAAGLQAVAVDVVFDLESDFAAYLACFSGMEILAQSELLDTWNQLDESEKRGLLDSFLVQYKSMSEEGRAQVRQNVLTVIESIGQRLQQLGQPGAEGMAGALEGLHSDLLQWYEGLEPGDRGELSGLFGTMNRLFGGPLP